MFSPKHRLIMVAAVGITAILALLILTRNWSGGSQSSKGAAITSGDLEVQKMIDLGTQPNGKSIKVPIKISNISNHRITLDSFHADCACIQIYTEHHGSPKLVSTLELEPSRSETVFADIRIAGEPGLKTSSMVEFRYKAKVPLYYDIFISYTAVASLYTNPKIVHFGEILAGSKETRQIDLRSDGTFDGTIESIQCSKPELFEVNFVPADSDARKKFMAAQPGQSLVGTILLTLNAKGVAGRLRDDVIIKDGGRDLLKIPVSAEIASEYRLSPSSLVLPRTGTNDILYSARILCRSRHNRQFVIIPTLDSELSSVFAITLKDNSSDPESTSVLEVQYTGEPPKTKHISYILGFKVSDDTGVHEASLPVTILPKK